MKKRSGGMVWGGVCVLLGFFGAGCATVPNAAVNPWPGFSTPAAAAPGGEADAIGGYAAGCLRGAAAPTPDGRGFQIMRPARGHFFGHPKLVAYLGELGARVESAGLGNLLIGDLSQARGGPTANGHRSHQNGLDVDIWFLLHAEKRSLTLLERETLSAPMMVTSDGVALTKDWTTAHEKVLKIAAGFPEVDRIFVNPAIKRALCAKLPPARRGWLRVLRPWWGHAEHFHVRLSCPPGNACTNGADVIGPSDGCDATLDWWFSEEARAKLAAPAPEGPSALPILPPACDEVLRL